MTMISLCIGFGVYNVDTMVWEKEPIVLVLLDKEPYQLERYSSENEHHRQVVETFLQKVNEALLNATDEGASLEAVIGGMIGNIVVALNEVGEVVLAPAYNPRNENACELSKYTIRSLTAILDTIERVKNEK